MPLKLSPRHIREQSFHVTYSDREVSQLAQEIYDQTVADVHFSLFSFWVCESTQHYDKAKQHIPPHGVLQTHNLRPAGSRIQGSSWQQRSVSQPSTLRVEFPAWSRVGPITGPPPNTPDRPAPLKIRSRGESTVKNAVNQTPKTALARSVSSPVQTEPTTQTRKPPSPILEPILEVTSSLAATSLATNDSENISESEYSQDDGFSATYESNERLSITCEDSPHRWTGQLLTTQDRTSEGFLQDNNEQLYTTQDYTNEHILHRCNEQLSTTRDHPNEGEHTPRHCNEQSSITQDHTNISETSLHRWNEKLSITQDHSSGSEASPPRCNETLETELRRLEERSNHSEADTEAASVPDSERTADTISLFGRSTLDNITSTENPLDASHHSTSSSQDTTTFGRRVPALNSSSQTATRRPSQSQFAHSRSQLFNFTVSTRDLRNPSTHHQRYIQQSPPSFSRNTHAGATDRCLPLRRYETPSSNAISSSSFDLLSRSASALPRPTIQARRKASFLQKSKPLHQQPDRGQTELLMRAGPSFLNFSATPTRPLASRIFSPMQSNRAQAGTAASDAAANNSQVARLESMFRSTMRMYVESLLKRTRARGAQLEEVDRVTLSAEDAAWYDANGEFLQIVFGRKFVRLEGEDKATFEDIATQLRGESSSQWVRDLFAQSGL
ncbi:hypothetical protein BU24DRAFT_478618 [Aaosphaeria arxii CBS 175.79]|uniref:Uncharacterized protein n=1 Tax=Aaosphaeria arxii CBS 175.79 TaxID=1450172 RepID=A0A6A5XX31_9PLEO|nr:uncharacterized protein BU24DRAFT_478618 [Aaosphaeria arxii CBS 175.79]KAF2017519.1 hypothetical protein BU24DRAFT_478618 [Aaosphaeria arxii CBS 175.79]